jgi:hypothetical protein
MNPNILYTGSINEDDEIVDPRFYHLLNPEPDFFKNFRDFSDNFEELSEDLNIGAIINLSKIEQNETKNEVQNELSEAHNGQNEIQNELNLNLNFEQIEDEKKEKEKEAAQIPQGKEKNKIQKMVLPQDIINLKQNLAVKILDDSLKSKNKDQLGNLCKEINYLNFKYGEKKIIKKEGSSMKLLQKKRFPK